MISPIGQTLSDRLVVPEEQVKKHRRRLAESLSFSHFVELIQIDEPLKRIFYEIECINGNWTVRELRRQIGSLLYERTGLSPFLMKINFATEARKHEGLKSKEQGAWSVAKRDIVYLIFFIGSPRRGVPNFVM